MKKSTFLYFVIFSITFCEDISAQSWDVVSRGSVQTNGFTSLLSYNDSLYVGGTFDSIGGVAADNVAVWDGAHWASVGTGLNSSIYLYTSTLYKDNGNLYFGAGLYLNSQSEGLAKYDGVTWSKIGTGIRWFGENHGPGLSVEAIAKFNNLLYIGGLFDTADGHIVDYIASYDGSQCSPVGGLTYPNVEITALAVFQGKLYAGSYRFLYAWDGTFWIQVATVNKTNGFGNNNDGIKSLVVDGNTLYVGGGFDSINSMPYSNVVKFDGTSWSALGTGIGSSTNDRITSMAMFNGSLYACGYFTSVDGQPTSGIAAWRSSSWAAFPASQYHGTYFYGSALAVHDNSLYMGCGSELMKLGHTNSITGLSTVAMNLRPNPAHSIVTLSADASLIGSPYIVTDIIGRQVWAGVVSGVETNIPIADINNGIYLLHIANAKHTMKFIKD